MIPANHYHTCLGTAYVTIGQVRYFHNQVELDDLEGWMVARNRTKLYPPGEREAAFAVKDYMDWVLETQGGERESQP